MLNPALWVMSKRNPISTFLLEQPGVGWVVIAAAGPELASAKYPRTYLVPSGDGLLTNLTRSTKDPTVAFTGNTSLTWQWRVVMAGPAASGLPADSSLELFD